MSLPWYCVSQSCFRSNRWPWKNWRRCRWRLKRLSDSRNWQWRSSSREWTGTTLYAWLFELSWTLRGLQWAQLFTVVWWDKLLTVCEERSPVNYYLFRVSDTTFEGSAKVASDPWQVSAVLIPKRGPVLEAFSWITGNSIYGTKVRSRLGRTISGLLPVATVEQIE